MDLKEKLSFQNSVLSKTHKEVVNLDPVCFIEILIEEMPWIISQELASLFIVLVNIFCNIFLLNWGEGN